MRSGNLTRMSLSWSFWSISGCWTISRSPTVFCSSGRLSASRSATVPAASLMSAVDVRDRVGAVLQPGDQHLEVLHRLVELLLVLDRRVEHGVEVLDHLADRLVAVGQCRRERGGLVEDVVDGAALTLEDRDERRRDVVDLLRVQRPKQRPESADQRVQVQRRLGSLDREWCRREAAACRLSPRLSSR